MSEQNRDFLREQQAALERMREMSRRATLGNTAHNMPPSPAFLKVGGVAQANDTPKKDELEGKNNDKDNSSGIKGFIDNLLSGNGDLGKPIFDKLGADPDMLLILGLLLILYSEKSDKMLLLALLYILM
ncbi:MAG: hypothetical protein IJZ75_04715 [Clostridia bacterium]|nr:hypothetical protein [Clostridia bacterium]